MLLVKQKPADMTPLIFRTRPGPYVEKVRLRAHRQPIPEPPVPPLPRASRIAPQRRFLKPMDRHEIKMDFAS